MSNQARLDQDAAGEQHQPDQPDQPAEDDAFDAGEHEEESADTEAGSDGGPPEKPADPAADPSAENADAADSEAEPPPEAADATNPDSADAAPRPPVLAKEPPRRGIAPAVAQPSARDKGLSRFLDTLDERARIWWAGRKERRAQLRTPAGQNRASAGPGGRTADDDRSDITGGSFQLPMPPRTQKQPEGQHSTGSEPVTGAAQQTAAEASAPGSQPTAEQDSSNRPAPAQPAHQEQTPNESAADASVPATAARPARVRRALDEQRRREVIMQKAQAIEDATAGYGAATSWESADDEEDLYTYIPPYNLPSRDPDPQPTKVDLARRIFVTIAALAAVVSAAWMLGWIGEADEPAVLSENGLAGHYAGGWFSGELALLSPDHNFYWLWPLIVVGLVIHAGFQWSLTQGATPRQRRSGWLVGAASLLTLAATACLHYGWFSLMVVVSVPIAVLLLDAVRQFNLYTARTTVERRLTDGVIGLFFGFSLVHAMSSVSVWLTVHNWHIPGVPPLLWAGIGLFICVWVAAFYAMTERGRITIALALGWGMFWLIFPRILGEATSVWVAIGAAMGAFIVILATQSRRHRINHAERRAAMGRPLEDII